MTANYQIDERKYDDVSEVHSETLEALLTGYTITGCVRIPHKIDYPLTDGVILFLRSEKGKTKVLQIGPDRDENLEILLSV